MSLPVCLVPSAPRGGVCLQGVFLPTPVLTSSGSHGSGRYASYWNAFLFGNVIDAYLGRFVTSENLDNRGFPEVDHLGIDARIVLE